MQTVPNSSTAALIFHGRISGFLTGLVSNIRGCIVLGISSKQFAILALKDIRFIVQCVNLDVSSAVLYLVLASSLFKDNTAK